MYRVMMGNTEFPVRSLIEVQRLYNHGRISVGDIMRRDSEQQWFTVGDALGESLLGSGSRARNRRPTIPQPPLISWGMVLFLGCVLGGPGLGFAGLLQGFWARRILPCTMPILWALCAMILPTAHFVWALSLIRHEHPPLITALIHIAVGFITADIAGICLASCGAMSVRRILLKKFGDKGFSMGLFKTMILGPVYVAYKAEELKRLHE